MRISRFDLLALPLGLLVPLTAGCGVPDQREVLRRRQGIMEVDCDRANPIADQFTITVVDEKGRTVRR